MMQRTSKLSLLALAQSILSVSASCNPTTATTACPAIPAMPSSVTYSLSPTNTADFTYEMADGISGDSTSGLVFSLAAQGDAPTMITNDYLLYGNVKAEIKSAPGVGMVSAFILMSDVLDEIDLEWLGAYDNQVQTNYYYRGETASYDRGGVSTVSTPEETTHTYEVDWTSTAITWSVDGVAVRTLTAASTSGYGFPDTPSQIKIGVWASGDPTNAAGTIEWGGGLIDYSAGPYNMTLYSLEVESYTTAGSFQYNVGGTEFTIDAGTVSPSTASTASAVQSGAASSTAKAAAASSKTTLTTSTTSGDSSQATEVAVVAAQAQVSGTSGQSASAGVTTRRSTTSTSTTSSKTSTSTSSTASSSSVSQSTNAAVPMTLSSSKTLSMLVVVGLTWMAGFVSL